MCKMASFVVTKKRVFWSETTDHHETIISDNKLKEQDVRGNYTFVRVEIAPPEGDFKLPISKWVYQLDQDVKPEWYDAKDVEKRCRFALKEWYKVCVIPANKTVSKLNRDVKLVLGTINNVRGSAVINNVWDSAVINNVWDSAVIKNVRDSAVINDVRGSAVIKNVMDSAVIKNVMGFAVINDVRGSAVIKNVGDSAGIKNVMDSATVIFYTTPPVDILKSASSVIIDRSGEIVVCFVGVQK